MSFNPQELLDSLGRLGGNSRALLSALQEVTTANGTQLMQQPAPAVGANINANTSSPLAGASSSSSSLYASQIQAILAASAPQQSFANHAYSVPSYNTDAPQNSNKNDIQQTLATLLVKQKLQQAQCQSRGAEITGTCSLLPSASASATPEGSPSPLQQMLRKIINGNNASLQLEQDTRPSFGVDLQNKLLLLAKSQSQQQPSAVQDIHGLYAAVATGASEQANCPRNVASVLVEQQQIQQEKNQPSSSLSKDDALAFLASLQKKLNSPDPPAPPVIAAPSRTVSESRGKPTPAALPERKRRRGRSGSFPQKIHQMLRDLEQEGRQDIASFVRKGTAFCIHRPKEFAKDVMPKYFKMGSYASFQRQLNLYNFIRIAEGPERGSYYHELFLQGKPLLSTTMKRKEAKKPAPKPAKSSPPTGEKGMKGFA